MNSPQTEYTHKPEPNQKTDITSSQKAFLHSFPVTTLPQTDTNLTSNNIEQSYCCHAWYQWNPLMRPLVCLLLLNLVSVLHSILICACGRRQSLLQWDSPLFK